MTRRLRKPESREISIKAFRLDQVERELQTRARTDMAVVKLYADMRGGKGIYKVASPFPEPVVFEDEDGLLWLADGYHRVHAALKLGMESIACLVIPGTKTDAILRGVQANLVDANTNKPTSNDRIHAAELMIRNGAGVPRAGTWDWADSYIADTVGISPATVQSVRRRLNLTESLPIPERVVKRNGRAVKSRFLKVQDRGIVECSNGTFHGSIQGKRHYLGTDRETAERRFAEMSRNTRLGALKKSSHLATWLNRRGLCVSVVSDDPAWGMGGLRAGGTYVWPLYEPNQEAVLAAGFRCLLAAAALPGIDRLIVCGYCRSETNLARIVRMAGDLPAPIEFFSPEELVELLGGVNRHEAEPEDSRALEACA